MYAAFVIIVVCFVAALATEGASWYLIYRKEDYQHLKKTIESLQSKGQTAARQQHAQRSASLPPQSTPSACTRESQSHPSTSRRRSHQCITVSLPFSFSYPILQWTS